MTDEPAPKRELKIWIAVRVDIPMSDGKFAAQVGHSTGRLYGQVKDDEPDLYSGYLADNEPKITVKAKNLHHLERIHRECISARIPCELIHDAGRSEIPSGTATVCAFGPAYRDELPKFLQGLQKLKHGERMIPADTDDE